MLKIKVKCSEELRNKFFDEMIISTNENYHKKIYFKFITH